MNEAPPAGVAEIIALAGSHGLVLDEAHAQVDDTGADFRVLRARDGDGLEWIVRVPRREDAARRSATERRVLDLVRDHLAVGVPDWRVFSERLMAYPRLRGEPAAGIDLDQGGYVWRFDHDSPPDPFLRSLAEALVSLHSIPEPEALAAGLPLRTPEQIRSALPRRMARCRDHLSIPPPLWERWNRWVQDDGMWPETPALVHGDLHPPHILVDHRASVVGLLDWSEAHLGDPATDFALLHASMGPAATRALLEHYRTGGGTVGPRMLEHIAELWAAYPVTLVEFALQSGEHGPLQLAQVLVEATAAGMAVEDR